jgi:hypothetical protein
VDGAYAGTGKESGNRLPSHGEVYGDGVTFLHTQCLESVSYTAYFPKKLGIGDLAAIPGFVCLVYNGGL